MSGIVLQGLVRDSAALAAQGLPVFASGATARGPVKETLGALQVPIQCGGVLVHPGDLIAGDDDGVVVVPREQVSAVADRIRLIHEREEQVKKALAAGPDDGRHPGAPRQAPAVATPPVPPELAGRDRPLRLAALPRFAREPVPSGGRAEPCDRRQAGGPIPSSGAWYVMTIRPGRGSRRWAGQASNAPAIVTGTTGAPVASASRNAPGRKA